MKYNPPYGSSDPNAAFVDRNTQGAQSGSRVPAAAIEHPQREIMAVIAGAGLTASGTDLTQLLQAIQQLIAAATGSGDTSNFVLMAQARARLPIFPAVQTTDGRIPVVSPSTGQVRVPAGYDFLHRGIFNVTTVQADFATAANKTYHLRWSLSGGFALNDLADLTYNPSSRAESDATFDSSYDDMLVSRVVTNASNVPTVTNLSNLVRLSAQSSYRKIAVGALNWTTLSGTSTVLNWARTPQIADVAINEFRAYNAGPDGTITSATVGTPRNLGVRLSTVSRYQLAALEYYFEDDKAGTSTADGLLAAIVTAMAV